jgi:hypothetical protein
LRSVLEVVDRHRGDDGVKAPKLRQGLSELALDELDPLVSVETLAGCLQHRLREVQADAGHFGAIGLKEREKSTVARPEVEDATRIPRYVFEQDALPL